MEFHNLLNTVNVPEKLKKSLFNNKGIEINQILPLSKINIFIGPNNSGKSLLIREILKQIINKTYPSTQSLPLINQHLSILRTTFENLFNNFYNITAVEFHSNGLPLQRNDIQTNIHDASEQESIQDILERLKTIQGKCVNRFFSVTDTRGSTSSINRDDINTPLLRETYNTIEFIKKYDIPGKYHKIYIPTVRTLRVYNNSNELELKTREEYDFRKIDDAENQEIESNVIIQNGQNIYEQILHLRNSTHIEETKLKDFQTFLSNNFFDNQPVSFITNAKEKVLYIKVGNEQEQPIHNLGDGLQMIILLTFPFFNYNQGIIAIEEPELFLHPALQKKLIQILSRFSKSDNFLVLIVTHSNHIIDYSAHESRASVFSIKKKGNSGINHLPSFTLENISYGDNSVLDLIGANKSSVFLSNCSIWVEGVTDKKYLSSYIEKYLTTSLCKPKFKHLSNIKEGLHYIFIYSAGDNIIHLDFNESTLIEEMKNKVLIKYLCGRSMVIIDDDDNKNTERKNKLEKELGLRLLLLPVNEIENLLAPEVIFKSVTSFSTIEKLTNKTYKPFQSAAYKKTKLGTYIDTKILPDIIANNGITPTSIKHFSDNSAKTKTLKRSKTLNCKVDFCNYAMKHIQDHDLTTDCINTIEQILQFISDNNPMLIEA